MIRHIALFRLKEEAPADTRQSLEEGLFLIARTISQISSYAYGGDLGLRDGNFDFGVVADFEDIAAFEGYVSHPDHQAFLKERLMPVLDERVSLQFEL